MRGGAALDILLAARRRWVCWRLRLRVWEVLGLRVWGVLGLEREGIFVGGLGGWVGGRVDGMGRWMKIVEEDVLLFEDCRADVGS